MNLLKSLLFNNFSFFSGIIPSSFIAYIVPDGRFSAADISSNTQVVVMDEWTPESLSCEDAKRVLQGELSVLICGSECDLT